MPAVKNQSLVNEQLFQALDNSLNGIVIGVGKFPKIIYANKSFEKISGYKKSDLLKFSRLEVLKMVHPDDRKLFFDRYIQRMHGKRIPKHYQFRGIKKDGEVRWFEVSARKFICQGQLAIQANFSDITYLKQAINEQKRNLHELKKYQFIIEQASEEIAMADLEEKIIYANSRWAKNHQYKKSEMIGKSLKIFHPKSEAVKIDLFNKELIAKRRNQGDFLHLRKDGTIYNAWMNNFVLNIDKKKYLIAMASDTTEKDSMIKELFSRNNQLQWIADNIGDAMIYQIKASVDGKRKFTYISNRCKDFHGISSEQVMKNASLLYRTFHPEDQKKVAEAEKIALTNIKPFKMEFRIKLPGNIIKWVYVVSVSQKQANGEYIWNGIEFDITERKKQQQITEDNLNKYKTLFENLNDGVVLLSPPQWNFFAANKKAQKMFGAKTELAITKKRPWNLSPKYQLDGQLSTVKAKKMINIAMNKGSNFFDWTHRTLQGKNFLCEIHLSKVTLHNKTYLQAVIRDVTEKRGLENKIIIESQRANEYLNTTKTIMVALDRQGRVKMINKFGVKTLGFPEKEIIGKNWFNVFVLSKEKKQVKAVFNEIMYGHVKTMRDFTNFIKTKNGPRLIEWHNSILKDGGKEIVGSLSSGNDITEKQEFYDRLIESENLYHTISESTIDCMKLVDLDGTILFANKAAIKNHAMKKRTMVGKKIWDIPPKDISQQVKNDFDKVNGKILNNEYKIHLKNGNYKYILRTYVPIKSRDNKVKRYYVQCRDITEVRRSKRIIEENNERYKLIFNNTDRLIYDYQLADGKIQWYGSVKDLIGYSSSEMTKKINIKKWETMIHPDDRPKALNDLNWAIDNHKPYHCYYRFMIKNGTYRYFEDNGVPMSDNSGRVIRVVGVMKDRTKEHEIDRAKSDFISVASHQLRTPLTGIKWFSELILSEKSGKLTTRQRKYIKNIYESNKRMIGLVSDLLNVSHIETNTKFEIVRKTVNLKKLLTEALNDNRNLLQTKNIKAKTSIKLTTPTMRADGEKIIQVLNNLLSNAVKYSRENGTIKIKISDTIDQVRFSIQDFGYGIPEYQQKNVFDKFFRADNVLSVATEGSGLGLYIAKAIIEAHGGEINFTSKENVGSTFYFTLPKKSNNKTYEKENSGSRR